MNVSEDKIVRMMVFHLKSAVSNCRINYIMLLGDREIKDETVYDGPIFYPQIMNKFCIPYIWDVRRVIIQYRTKQ